MAAALVTAQMPLTNHSQAKLVRIASEEFRANRIFSPHSALATARLMQFSVKVSDKRGFFHNQLPRIGRVKGALDFIG